MNCITYKNFINLLTIVISIIFLLGYIISNYRQIYFLFSISFLQVFFITLFLVLTVLTRGLLNTYFYRQLKVPLSYYDGTELAIINILGNIFPFSGGLFAKGLYLKNHYQLQFTKYFSSTASLSVCFIAVNGILNLLCVVILSLLNYNVPAILTSAFVLMSSTIFLLWIPVNFNFFPKRFQLHVHNIQVGWSLLIKQPFFFICVIMIQLVSLFFVALRLWIMYKVFSIHVSILICLMLAGLFILISIINIAPAGIGIREGVLGGVSYLMGYPFGISASVIAFDRVCSIFIVFLMGLVFSAISKKKILKLI